jgi:hypothetical protein
MKTGLKISTRSIVVAVLALGLFAGTFVAVRYITVTMRAISGIPGIAFSEATEGPAAAIDLPTGVPEAPAIELPPAWDGASRVTILLMGIDTEPKLDPQGKISPDRVGRRAPIP